jgi:hypothetical protein
MQYLEGNGTPVLYIGRTVLKGILRLKLCIVFLTPARIKMHNLHHLLVFIFIQESLGLTQEED